MGGGGGAEEETDTPSQALSQPESLERHDFPRKLSSRHGGGSSPLFPKRGSGCPAAASPSITHSLLPRHQLLRSQCPVQRLTIYHFTLRSDRDPYRKKLGAYPYPKKANMSNDRQREFPQPLHCESAVDARGGRKISTGMSRLREFFSDHRSFQSFQSFRSFQGSQGPQSSQSSQSSRWNSQHSFCC